jgi:hypothetical protein
MFIIDMFALKEGSNNPGMPGSCCILRIITSSQQDSFFEQQDDSFEDAVDMIAAFQSQETAIRQTMSATITAVGTHIMAICSAKSNPSV